MLVKLDHFPRVWGENEKCALKSSWNNHFIYFMFSLRFLLGDKQNIFQRYFLNKTFTPKPPDMERLDFSIDAWQCNPDGRVEETYPTSVRIKRRNTLISKGGEYVTFQDDTVKQCHSDTHMKTLVRLFIATNHRYKNKQRQIQAKLLRWRFTKLRLICL